MNRSIHFLCCALVLAMLVGCRAEAPSTSESEPAPPTQPVTPPSAQPATDAPAIDIPNAKMPSQGLLTGGQPSVEQLEEAARAGYRTIVNLRAPGEQEAWDEATKAADLGLRYVAIPIANADGLTPENARQLAEIVDDSQAHPVMVHCASGNRVGALFAMKAAHIDGKGADEALTFGRSAGLTGLEDAVRERLPIPGQSGHR